MPDFGIGEFFAAASSLFGGGLAEASAGAGLAEAGAAGLGAAEAGGIGAATGATFADSLLPATFGTAAGAAGVESGAFDVAGALAGAAGAAGAGAGVAGDILAGTSPAGLAGAAPGVAGTAGTTGATAGALPAVTPAGASAGSGLSAAAGAAPAAAAPSASSALDLSGGGLFTGATTSSPASGAIGGSGGIISDAAGGATASLGSPLTSTYGPVSDFATNASGAAGGVPAAEGSDGIFGSGVKWGDVGSAIKGYGAPAIALGGLGLNALRGTTPMPGQSAISSEAAALGAQGTKLQSYLDTGTLPPGVGQSIKQASDSAKAAIRSRYAQMGGDTSAMHQDLANIDQLASGQGATIALQLLNTGVNETQLSSQLYGQLLNLAVQQNAQLGSAIGNLATSLTPRVLVQGAQA